MQFQSWASSHPPRGRMQCTRLLCSGNKKTQQNLCKEVIKVESLWVTEPLSYWIPQMTLMYSQELRVSLEVTTSSSTKTYKGKQAENFRAARASPINPKAQQPPRGQESLRPPLPQLLVTIAWSRSFQLILLKVSSARFSRIGLQKMKISIWSLSLNCT